MFVWYIKYDKSSLSLTSHFVYIVYKNPFSKKKNKNANILVFMINLGSSKTYACNTTMKLTAN